MRILFLSNYYPPFAMGGYEQWCHEVAAELMLRGHDLRVLTSRAGNAGQPPSFEGVPVDRALHLEVEGGVLPTGLKLLRGRSTWERNNLQQVHQMIESFRPESSLIWGMWNVPRSVPALLESLLPGRVAYYFCDYWPSLPSAYIQQWQAPSSRWATRWPKALMAYLLGVGQSSEKRPDLRLEHPICVSQAVRSLLIQSGVPVEHARIVHGGVRLDNVNDAPIRQREREASPRLRLLYLGRLVPEKGVHTAISALGLLVDRAMNQVTLDIVGGGEAGYERELRALARGLGTTEAIKFLGTVAHAQVRRLMANYDALVFPSEWEEPFARTVLEAMAAGLVVIGTTTGGTGEVLVDGETGLTFPAGDASALASQILHLIRSSDRGQGLAQTATCRVKQQFSVGRMVDELEGMLRQVASPGAAIIRGIA